MALYVRALFAAAKSASSAPPKYQRSLASPPKAGKIDLARKLTDLFYYCTQATSRSKATSYFTAAPDKNQ